MIKIGISNQKKIDYSQFMLGLLLKYLEKTLSEIPTSHNIPK